MEKCDGAREATDNNKIRRMRFACWITKATDINSKYLILFAFSWRRWLRERASASLVRQRFCDLTFLQLQRQGHILGLAGGQDITSASGNIGQQFESQAGSPDRKIIPLAVFQNSAVVQLPCCICITTGGGELCGATRKQNPVGCEGKNRTSKQQNCC